MDKEYLLYYLIGINVLSFLLFTIDRIRHDYTGKTIHPVWIFSVVTLIGGSVGTNLYFLLFFRTNKKPKGMEYSKEVSANLDYYRYWRVFSLVMLIIHAAICLYIYLSPAGHSIRERFAYFLTHSMVLWIYLLVINIVTFIIFAVDKKKAENNKNRVREFVLLLFSFVGGALGGIIAMKIMHHKTRKQAFAVGMPLILLAHVVVIVFLILTLPIK